MPGRNEAAIAQGVAEVLIQEWRLAAGDERGDRKARVAYREAADELEHNLPDESEGQHAYLLSLTQAQLEQLQNDDIAVVNTELEKFVFVPKEHENEAIDHLHGNDVDISIQEVTSRD